MSLSKIHRAEDINGFRQFQFLDFDEGANDNAPSGVRFKETAQSSNQRPGRDTAEAFTKGRQEGRQEAGSHLELAAEGLARGLEEISRLRESILKASTQDMLRLVLSIVRQVIHTEVTTDPEIILKTIDTALQAAVSGDNFQILVNPDDLDVVEERKPLFLASIKGIDNIEIKASENVERGGCLVESELGQVDASISGQLEEVRKTLLGSLAEDG